MSRKYEAIDGDDKDFQYDELWPQKSILHGQAKMYIRDLQTLYYITQLGVVAYSHGHMATHSVLLRRLFGFPIQCLSARGCGPVNIAIYWDFFRDAVVCTPFKYYPILHQSFVPGSFHRMAIKD